jgi:hypothetical protein
VFDFKLWTSPKRRSARHADGPSFLFLLTEFHLFQQLRELVITEYDLAMDTVTDGPPVKEGTSP